MRDWMARLGRRFGGSGGIECRGWWLWEDGVGMRERLVVVVEGRNGGAAKGMAEAKVEAVLVAAVRHPLRRGLVKLVFC